MCVVSMIGDHYKDHWFPKPVPDLGQYYPPASDTVKPINLNDIFNPSVSKADFDALKKEVLEMKELLKRAIKYDEKNNEPHCEMEEKVALLKKVAELVGVDLSEIFGNK